MTTPSVIWRRVLWIGALVVALVMGALAWLYGEPGALRAVLSAKEREKRAAARAAEADVAAAAAALARARAAQEAAAATAKAASAQARADSARTERERIEREMEANDAVVAAEYNRRRDLVRNHG